MAELRLVETPKSLLEKQCARWLSIINEVELMTVADIGTNFCSW